MRNRLGPYHPMPGHVVRAIFELGDVQPHDRMMDLGAGDGQLIIEAHRQRGCQHATGFELNKELVLIAENKIEAYKKSLDPIEAAKLNLSVINADARKVPLDSTTFFSLYLSEHGNVALRPALTEHLLKVPEARVASFLFPMDKWKPIAVVKQSGIPLFLYNHKSL